MRREGAIAAHRCSSWRLGYIGVGYVDQSFDMSNAFGTLDLNELNDITTSAQTASLDDAEILDNFHWHIVTTMDCVDKQASAWLNEGTIMGDGNAGEEFTSVFCQKVVGLLF